jgi:hydroxyethylthiazole kinase-like uncharacterized protein yjeF
LRRAERIDRRLLRRWPLPVPKAGSKENRGRILVVAGAPQMPGAAILAGTAALRAGAGKLRIATARSVAAVVGAAVPEAYVDGLSETAAGGIGLDNAASLIESANAADALVFGPGCVEEDAAAQLGCAVVKQLCTPIVLDAAALATCAAEPAVLQHLGGAAVLTPHAGEMASLCGCPRSDVEAEPARFAVETAKRLRAVVVMKGATTFVAAPDGALYRNDRGSIGLATSGSGDALAGIIGGLLARGVPAAGAAAWGVHLHARAGALLEERIGLGFLAREIAAEIPALMRGAR